MEECVGRLFGEERRILLVGYEDGVGGGEVCGL